LGVSPGTRLGVYEVTAPIGEGVSTPWRTRAEGPSDSSDLGDRANAAFIEQRY